MVRRAGGVGSLIADDCHLRSRARDAARDLALWDKTPVGPLRLATPHLVAQMGWWEPLVVAGVVSGGSPWQRPRRLSAAQAQVVVWTGSAFTFAVAFSLAGGVFHTDYVAVLGPPLAALGGIGASWLWQRWHAGAWSWAGTAMLLVMAALQTGIEQCNQAWQLQGWPGAMLVAEVGVLTVTAAAMHLLAPQRRAGRLSSGLAISALLATLALPLAWALSTVLARPNVAAPAADIHRLIDGTMDTDMAVAVAMAVVVAVAAPPARERQRAHRLLEFHRAQRRSERFLLAVPNALQAAPLIVRTGESVMAMGGCLGRDPILTPSQLERMVQAGELRCVIVGGPSMVPPDTPRERLLADRIRVHGQRVDPALWRDGPEADRSPAPVARRPGGPAQLYDLRPEAADRTLMPS